MQICSWKSKKVFALLLSYNSGLSISLWLLAFPVWIQNLKGSHARFPYGMARKHRKPLAGSANGDLALGRNC